MNPNNEFDYDPDSKEDDNSTTIFVILGFIILMSWSVSGCITDAILAFKGIPPNPAIEIHYQKGLNAIDGGQ